MSTAPAETHAPDGQGGPLPGGGAKLAQAAQRRCFTGSSTCFREPHPGGRSPSPTTPWLPPSLCATCLACRPLSGPAGLTGGQASPSAGRGNAAWRPRGPAPPPMDILPGGQPEGPRLAAWSSLPAPPLFQDLLGLLLLFPLAQDVPERQKGAAVTGYVAGSSVWADVPMGSTVGAGGGWQQWWLRAEVGGATGQRAESWGGQTARSFFPPQSRNPAPIFSLSCWEFF